MKLLQAFSVRVESRLLYKLQRGAEITMAMTYKPSVAALKRTELFILGPLITEHHIDQIY